MNEPEWLDGVCGALSLSRKTHVRNCAPNKKGESGIMVPLTASPTEQNYKQKYTP